MKKVSEKNVMGIDPGHWGTKVITQEGTKLFNSGVFEINHISELDGKHLERGFKAHSHIVSINGSNYVVGQFAAKMNRTKKLKKDKDNQEAYVRILTQVAKHVLETGKNVITLATLNPISAANKKEQIRQNLKGEHVVVLDGHSIRFEIERVDVFNEGSISVLAFEDEIDVENFTIVDIGSSTINVADFDGFEYIHTNSTTIPVGVETFRNKVDKQVNYNKLIEYVDEVIDEVIHMKQKVYVISGDMTLFDRLEENKKIAFPSIKFNDTQVNTTFSNVIGAYMMVAGE